MRIGMAGLGRMGANIATRLVRAGHEVVGRDPDEASRSGVMETAEMVEVRLATFLEVIKVDQEGDHALFSRFEVHV